MKKCVMLCCAALVVACGDDGDDGGGSSDLGGDFSGFDMGSDSAGTVDLGDPGDPVDANWQLLFGSPNVGSYDQEGLVGLSTNSSGEVVAFADQRYNDDPYGNTLVMLTVGADGSIVSQQDLIFSEDPDFRAVALGADDRIYLALESAPLVAVLSAAGELQWARSFERDPYAFGGMDVFDMALAEDGSIYLAGGFNPSEPGSAERGFVAKVGADGSAQWLRSWQHESFFEDTRVAVSAAGVFVIDLVPGSNEIDRRIVLVGFDADGNEIGQHAFLVDSFDGPIGAFQRAEVVADADGVDVIGASSSARDGSFAMLVNRVRLDGALELVSNDATRVPHTTVLYPRRLRLTEHESGALSIGADFGERYGIIHFDAGSGLAQTWDVVGDDGSAPYIDDDDYILHLAPAADGTVYAGGSTETLGSLELRPYHALEMSRSLTLVDPELDVTSDTFRGNDSDLTVTVTENTDGVADDGAEGDEDIFVLRAPL